ncbi:hypothetical protein [Rhodobium gokarnense]|uniref:Zn-finger nucleic acid-binding protein n=1 Tax=Rhodobium gokarnense TaxID=364296 RepID=A0ABT3HCH7_9HYPH|nr:hypothetical protein [Rhodobium gokarnense]MCW2307981.1 Zn-finger nucleic acid-binding protein [Rhodobium gokarnense]
MSKPCKNRSLVSSDICRIKYCAECGAVHLDLGNMTLHLTTEQFDRLAGAFGEAVVQKQAIDRAEGNRPAQTASNSRCVH